MTTSSFETSRLSEAEKRSVKIGQQIHAAVVEEGRREGVHAYLYHDSQGRAWFEKYNCETKTVTRRFSPELEAMMRRHKEDLRVYARYCETDRFEDSGKAGALPRMRREIAVERCRVIVEMQTHPMPGESVGVDTPPPPWVGSEPNEKKNVVQRRRSAMSTD